MFQKQMRCEQTTILNKGNHLSAGVKSWLLNQQAGACEQKVLLLWAGDLTTDFFCICAISTVK